MLTPLCRELFGVDTQIHYHAYVLRYRDTAPGLRFHTDDADFTFNLNLGDAWTGGDLRFVDKSDRPGTPDSVAGWAIAHEPGFALLHDDCYHAADPITSGQRTQLIFWILKDDEPWKRDFFPKLESSLLS